MITLITGQPGAGKTLRALYMVKAMAEKENRPVFYSGITDLALEWTELEKAEDWHKCPTGAIIVIDECQRIFRPRPAAAPVPESVSKFETHRHQGLDIFLITQHPMLLDSNIRRLVGRHLHVMRAFGAGCANVHEWNEIRDNCDKSRLGSQSILWKYPKEVYSYYKSAELHTHKFRPPLRVIFLILGPLLVALFVWLVVTWFKDRQKPKVLTPPAATAPGSAASASSPGAPSSSVDRSKKSRDEWFNELTPRIEGLPHTAAAFDRVTAPTLAPAPVGCIKTRICRCYTDQGTVLPVTDEVCESLVDRGFFRSWEHQKTMIDRK